MTVSEALNLIIDERDYEILLDYKTLISLTEDYVQGMDDNIKFIKIAYDNGILDMIYKTATEENEDVSVLRGKAVQRLTEQELMSEENAQKAIDILLDGVYLSEHDDYLQRQVLYYIENAEKGDMEAQITLGDFYYDGYGVEQSYEKALEWYKKAAEQGDAWAAYMTGECYFEGKGTVTDYGKAIYWYEKAAKADDECAQLQLGHCYYISGNKKENYEKAVYWYLKAAKQGNEFAQRELADCYFYGVGTEQSYKKAFEWYKKAAENGNNLAKIKYEQMKGAEK